jgi:NAD(P)-dependent dehydrogenase (short-subunit alcohol dehydrogenase family)
MDYFGMTKEHMAASVPLGRMGMPEDIASAVLFLCSTMRRLSQERVSR